MQAGTERYAEEVTLLLFGHLIDTDLSDTLSRIEACESASVADVSLAAPQGTEEVSSARLRLEARAGETETALAAVRELAAEKNLRLVEPLTGWRRETRRYRCGRGRSLGRRSQRASTATRSSR